ncbi:MAG TPA: N-acetylglucosamine-6-phosphate deacetylase [Vicinamibacterales bacterium]|nr:N-acetylglucosamine-6-phosphate deacetylase [Vicinamibacterales bacterium]
MILLAGADLVLPDGVRPRTNLLIDGGRIVAIEPAGTPVANATRVDCTDCVIVPGFIDVHVHGVEGHDVMDGPGAIAAVAERLPRYGVTAFCPTSIACAPAVLTTMFEEITALRRMTSGTAARVLPAHLESNFISPEFKGAQPLQCLRRPPLEYGSVARALTPPTVAGQFDADDVMAVITAHQAAVAIVTMAPELEGGIELVRALVARGHRVSIGHSGASYHQTFAAIDAGVSQATHLFNRMSAMTHRSPGVPGAVLQSPAVTAELICDGFHVHPALLNVAIRTKGASGIMAITDGTAGSGLPIGSRTRLGGRPILVTARTAELEDGTLAGSVLTMDAAFRSLVQQVGVSLVDAAVMCATTPARQLGLSDRGRLAVDSAADLVILTRDLRVRDTYLEGHLWRNTVAPLDV